nr:LysM peptidoglycan-binding domain-containing protein [uncultured Shimia sp.]
MTKIAQFLGQNAVVVGGTSVVAVVAVIAVAVSGVFAPSAPVSDETNTVQPVAQVPDEGTSQEAAIAEVVDPQKVTDETTPDRSKTIPQFDVVRIEPDGSTLVAGQAAAKSDIVLLLDAVDLVTVTTDSAGKFVAFVAIPPSLEPQILALVQRHEDGDVFSEQTVIISPTLVASTAEPTPTPIPADPQSPALDQTTELKTSPTPETTPSPTVPTDAPAVILVDADGVKVVQPPRAASQGPEVMSTVALDSISYSDDGEVELAGRGRRDGSVRVYLDNTPITTSRIREDGNWRTELPDVDTGVYTLRVDEVDAAGEVISRVETPFQREDQDTIDTATAAQDAQTRAEIITVQPGSTLWAIAKSQYGEGLYFVRVYEANKDRIRDPDLIYPGQIFDIPN